jgi:ABC-2 type transport system permease protein
MAGLNAKWRTGVSPVIHGSLPDGRDARPPQSARQQLAAVAELRWRIFVNSLRTVRSRLELASRIFVSLAFLAGGIGGAIGLGGAAWFSVSQGNPEWLGGLLWPVFLFWQLFPLMATAFTQNVDSSNLLRFPLNYRSYFLIRMVYGSLEPATAVASLWLLGIDIGIGVARPRLLPWATIVLLTFALVNLLLARALFAWLERWLAQRRTREIMGIIFFLFVLSFQLIGPLIAVYEHRSAPDARILGQKISNAQRPSPPGLGAAAIAGWGQTRPGFTAVAASATPFLLLGCYGIAFLWLLNFRLRAEYRGENLSESARRKARTSGLPAVRPGWNLPGLPGPVAAVFEKELRYLGRSGPMLFTLIVPLFMLAVFRSSGRNEGLLAHGSGFTFPIGAAYSLLLLTNLSYNNFGADGTGAQFFFASPVPFRHVMLGKNLAHTAVFAVEVLLVWAGTCLLYRAPSPGVVVATLAGILFVLPIDLAAGNLFSIYSPSRIEAGVFGRQRASLTTVLASFAIRGALFGMGALMLWFARGYGNSWMEWLIFLLPAALGFSLYLFFLGRVDGMALNHRENLISNLGRRQ